MDKSGIASQIVKKIIGKVWSWGRTHNSGQHMAKGITY
jgi:hypothetical protein